MESNATLDLERDLLIVEAIVFDLRPYLLSTVLYWPLTAPTGSLTLLPRGTLGGLLLRLHRLDALRERLSGGQAQRLGTAHAAVSEQLGSWRVQAEDKAMREMSSRLHAWDAFLEECEDNPARYDPEYPTQAEGRTVIDLLIAFARRAAEQRSFSARLAAVDRRLREIAAESDFVWDPAMIPAFPHERFWWLYMRPRQPGEQTDRP